MSVNVIPGLLVLNHLLAELTVCLSYLDPPEKHDYAITEFFCIVKQIARDWARLISQSPHIFHNSQFIYLFFSQKKGKPWR